MALAKGAVGEPDYVGPSLYEILTFDQLASRVTQALVS